MTCERRVVVGPSRSDASLHLDDDGVVALHHDDTVPDCIRHPRFFIESDRFSWERRRRP